MAELVNFPPEIICCIASFLDIKSANNLRLVCVTNQQLYDKVFVSLTADVKKRAILKITDKKCMELDFLKHYEYLSKSEFQICIEIPRHTECTTFCSRLFDLINNHHERVTQLVIQGEVCTDLLRKILPLPHLNNLQKMTVQSPSTQITELILTSMRNNAGLQTLDMSSVRCDEILFKKGDFPNLKNLTMESFSGKSALSLLTATASNLTKLNMFNMSLKFPADLQFPNLQKLYIDYCRGEISSLITRAAPRLTYLELSGIDMDTQINKVMSNLKVAVINGQKIECPAVLKSTGKLKDLIKNPRKRKLN